MELDDLKHSWQQNTPKQNINTDIMELIQHKSYGPIAAMKRVFRKQIITMTLIPFLLMLTNMQDLHAVFTSVLFWCYVVFCMGVIAFALYNYHIATRMEDMTGMVKANMGHQIALLEKRKQMELIGLRLVLIVFIILTETLPYFQHYRMLDKWHSLPVVVRCGAYALLLALQYFMNRRLSRRNIGRHLAYLKELMNEMQ